MLTDHKPFNSFDKYIIETSNEGCFARYEILEDELDLHKSFHFTIKQQQYNEISSGFTKGTGIIGLNAISWQDYEYVR